MSSDGKLLLPDAVSGNPVSIKEKEVSINTAGCLDLASGDAELKKYLDTLDRAGYIME